MWEGRSGRPSCAFARGDFSVRVIRSGSARLGTAAAAADGDPYGSFGSLGGGTGSSSVPSSSGLSVSSLSCDSRPGTARCSRSSSVLSASFRSSSTNRAYPFGSFLGRAEEAAPRQARARRRRERESPGWRGFRTSGRRDLNSGPLVPQTSALTRLRHAPFGSESSFDAWSAETAARRSRTASSAASQATPGQAAPRLSRSEVAHAWSAETVARRSRTASSAASEATPGQAAPGPVELRGSSRLVSGNGRPACGPAQGTISSRTEE